MPSYSDLLKDPRWQRRRLESLERSNWSCEWCGGKTRTLHVHHRWYERGRMPWDYPNSALWTLCDRCHKSIGEYQEFLQKLIGLLSYPEMMNLGGALLKYLEKRDLHHPERGA